MQRRSGIHVPLIFGWEIAVVMQRVADIRQHIVGPFRTYRAYAWSVSSITVAIIVGSIFFFHAPLRAATYTWVQTSWAGGITANTAIHPTHQTGWTEYSAKDSSVTAGATVALSTQSLSQTETTDTSFAAGTVSSATVTGTGSAAFVELSSSEGSGATIVPSGLSGATSFAKTAVYESVTDSTWYIATYAAKTPQLVQYQGDGTNTTALGSVDLSSYFTNYTNVVFTPSSGLLWVTGWTAGAYKLLSINPSTRTVTNNFTLTGTGASTNCGFFVYDSALDVFWLSYDAGSGPRIAKITTSGSITLSITPAATPYCGNNSGYADSGTSALYYLTNSGTLYKQPKDGSAGSTAALGGTANRQLAYDPVNQAIWTANQAASPNGVVNKVLLSNLSVSTYSSGFTGGVNGISYDSYHQQMITSDASGGGVRKVRLSDGQVTLLINTGVSAIYIMYEPIHRAVWSNYAAVSTFITYSASGNFTSQILDTTYASTYGAVTWNGTVPTNTTLTLKVRTSNSPSMAGATAWASCTGITSGQNMSLGGCVTNGHRYIQYRADFSTSQTTISSKFLDVSLAYSAYTNGTITSSIFDAGDATNILADLSWTTSGSGTVQLQARTSADGNTWTSWLGPTGTGDYYTNAAGGQSIHTSHHDGSSDRYIQYKAFLISADGSSTPTLTGVTVTYVVNAPPEFQAAPTATQNVDGTVTIQYAVRSTDTATDTGSIGFVTPSFEYSIDNGSHWSSITTGLPAGSTTPKAVDAVTYTNYSVIWTAKSQINGTYATQTKIRVTVSDLQAANATAQSSTTAFVLDVKDPVLGGTPIAVDASTVPATLSLSATDDTTLQMCITLDNTLTNCHPYAASATLALTTDPDTAYVTYVDSAGNTASASAVSPQTPSNLVIRDISNPTTSEYQLFLTWAATSISAPQFSQYRIYHSTNGTSFSPLATISDRTINYYLHKPLTSGTEHWYKVAAATNTGNVSYFSGVIHGTANGQGGGTDVTAPTISSVVATSITTQSAVITWNTDELSNSTVGYSTTPALFTEEAGSATMVDSTTGVGGHSVTLTNLIPNTVYYLRIKSRDPSGNEAEDTNGGDGYIVTTLAGPTISNVTTSEIDNTTATITWTTNLPASSTVIYATNALLTMPTTVTTSDLVTAHAVTLTGLTLGTRYYYEVRSGVASDPNGGIFFSFVTTADITPPVISAITVAPITDTQAVVQWITNEKATSQLSYGTISGSYPVALPTDTTLNISHTITISTLTPTTTYVFRLTSTDSSGNTSSSTESSFTTLEKLTNATDLQALIDAAKNANTDTAAPNITAVSVSDITDVSAGISWKTDEAANSFVQFGPTDTDQLVYGNWIYGTTHAISLLHLAPATQYSFRTVSADVRGNIATTTATTFTTAAATQATLESQLSTITSAAQALPGPIISGQPRVDVTSSTALISWSTDKAANSLVSFATEAEYFNGQTYTQTVGDPDRFINSHSVSLVSLQPDTVYHAQVRSKTEVSQLATTPDFTFRTAKKIFTIENYSVDTPANDRATFRWTTSEAATATVQLVPYRNNVRAVDELKTVVDDARSLIHQFTVTDLEPALRYNVELVSVNADGQRTTKTIDAFSTSSVSLPPVISNIRVDSALSPGEKVKVQTIVSWTTNIPSTSQVFYREGVGKADTELPEKTDLDSSYTKKHITVITAFNPGAVYQLRVESKDSNGQVATAKPLTILTPQQERTVFQVITNAVQQVFGWTGAFSK